MSLFLPALRGRSPTTAGGGGGGGPPAIGAQLVSWSADGVFGTMWQDETCIVPAGLSSRVAAIKTAQGNVFSQSDAPQRPQLQGASQNGLPGLYFNDHRDDYLECVTPALLSSLKSQSALTVMLVWKVLVRSGTDTGIHARTSGANGGIRITRTGGGDDTDAGRTGTSSTIPTYHNATNISAAYATVLTFAGFGGSPKKNTVYVQDVAKTANANTDAADSAAAWATLTLGARKASVGHEDFLTGTLYELLIWDAAADASGVTNIFTYANTKWGL